MACRQYFGGITADRTVHCGDQFLSLSSSNDFRVCQIVCNDCLLTYFQARLVCTTAWVANPSETVALLDELEFHSRS
jgi:IMP and pyridine-specific 5'-nucleotidase